MASKPFTWRTTAWSLGGLAAGVAVGSALGARPGEHTTFTLSMLTSLGTLWMNALRMLALPLALGNTICAMVGEKTARAAGRIGGAIAIYLVLLLLGAALVLVVVPPILHSWTVDHAAIATLSQTASGKAHKAAADTTPPPGPGDALVGLMPRNLFQSAANEDYLKLLIFAMLFGLALRKASPERGGLVTHFIEGVTETLMILVRWVIQLSPFAMFALAATFAASSGARIVGILGRFVLLECCLMLAFVAFLYPLSMFAGGLSFRKFAAAALGPQMVALSTRSSLAALPAMLTAAEIMAPANQMPSRAILPLAVNIFKVNRTISALCRLLTILYFWSVPASGWQIYTFLVTVIVLSFSELGLPGGTQMRTLPAYLAAGCPIEAVILLEVIEPFSDICKTLLNVTGDLSIAAIVTRWSERPDPAPAPAMAAAASAVPSQAS